MREGRLDEPAEHRVRAQRTALELGVELHAHEERVVLQVDNPSEFRSRLLKLVTRLGLMRKSEIGEALSQQLLRDIPDKKVPLFGSIRVSSRKLAHWYLLYAIAINRHGKVPQELIRLPWTSSENPAEKYIESSVAAAWAVTQLQQNDRATLQALQAMGNQASLPPWVREDFAAALQALSSQ